MSSGARIALAIMTLFCAASFAAIGLISGDQLSAGAWPFYGISAFCVVIAVACLMPRSRPVTLRLIGSIIFLVYVCYFFDSLGDISILRAFSGFCVWGLPSGYLAIKGTYPSWGRASAAFQTEANRRADADERGKVSSRKEV